MSYRYKIKFCADCHDNLHRWMTHRTERYTLCTICCELVKATQEEEDHTQNDQWYIEQYVGGKWPIRGWYKRGWGRLSSTFQGSIIQLTAMLHEDKDLDQTLFRLRRKKTLWTLFKPVESIPAALFILE